jgi:ribonuclease D
MTDAPPGPRKIAPSKEQTAHLDTFVGLPLERIIVPATASEFAEATAHILAVPTVGFDTESKPTFVAGEVSDGPHIVQFALADKAFIFQLHREACRASLMTILESTAVQKVGFGLGSDRGQLRAKLQVNLQAVLDLETVFRERGYAKSTGVRGAVAIMFNQKFHKSKRVTTSNWAVPRLAPSQLLYAANDAYAAFKVFEALRLTQI